MIVSRALSFEDYADVTLNILSTNFSFFFKRCYNLIKAHVYQVLTFFGGIQNCRNLQNFFFSNNASAVQVKH